MVELETKALLSKNRKIPQTIVLARDPKLVSNSTRMFGGTMEITDGILATSVGPTN